MSPLICEPDLQEKQDYFLSTTKAREKFEISFPAFEDAPSSVKAFFYFFLANYPDISLKRPIRLCFERGVESGAFIVGNEEFNKYGIGRSKEEAIKDFEDNIVSDYLELCETPPDQMSDDAKELMRLYRSYFVN